MPGILSSLIFTFTTSYNEFLTPMTYAQDDDAARQTWPPPGEGWGGHERAVDTPHRALALERS